MDGLELPLPAPYKSVQHAVGGITEGTGQYSAVVLQHPDVLAGGAGNMDVMKCPILQEEAVFDAGGVEMMSYDVTRVVNSTSPSSRCSRVINLGELSGAQQKSVVSAIVILEES